MKISRDRIADACAKLDAAPKEDARSVRAAIFDMRAQLMSAMIEKHWTVAQLRDWLATEGIDIPV